MAAVTRKCFDPALDQRSNQLFPVRCLTCGGMVGRHQLEFEELVERQQEEKTRNDHLTVLSALEGVSDREERIRRLREHRARRRSSAQAQHQEKLEFLEKRKLVRMCCRTVFLARPKPENGGENHL